MKKTVFVSLLLSLAISGCKEKTRRQEVVLENGAPGPQGPMGPMGPSVELPPVTIPVEPDPVVTEPELPPVTVPELPPVTVPQIPGTTGPVEATPTGEGPNGESPRSCFYAFTTGGMTLLCDGQAPINIYLTKGNPGLDPTFSLGIKTWAPRTEVCNLGGTTITLWSDANKNKIFDEGETDYREISICKPISVGLEPSEPQSCNVTSPLSGTVMVMCSDVTEVIPLGAVITVCMHDNPERDYTYTWSIEQFLADIFNKKPYTYSACRAG